jgi:hypothetical protein
MYNLDANVTDTERGDSALPRHVFVAGIVYVVVSQGRERVDTVGRVSPP